MMTMAAGPTVQPAKPLLLTRMTFSSGTVPSFRVPWENAFRAASNTLCHLSEYRPEFTLKPPLELSRNPCLSQDLRRG